METRGPASSIENRKYQSHSLKISSEHPYVSGPASTVDRIAHDFNNFLGVVISNLDLLERKLDPEDKAFRCSQRALEAALRASEYTSDLLAFSRKGRGNLSLTNLAPLVEKTAKEFRHKETGRQLNVDLEVDEDLGCAYLNRTDLERALRQLLCNSSEALQEGGTITVRTGRSAERTEPHGQEDLFIEISDSGSGMDSETVERCIEPFFTTKKGNNKKGLGLNQVLGFVLRAGGEFHIMSTPGEGTTVRLEFPRRCSEEPESKSARKISDL